MDAQQAEVALSFDGIALQLTKSADRASFARCTVTVHRLLDRTLAVSFLDRVLARHEATGAALLQPMVSRRKVA